ncbi:hypothetical protein ACIRS1_30660 [Kitasatospora sp. NPDC101176]|uniref:hypothetical protein n=1 Tax=Kitasatospora sp. NPDC101176 TaxID=3364099 RepID=UPI003807E444
MYSYDVSSSPGLTTTAPRSIPGMRPSYDAEHPHSTTPIYDELYSEYRRLFRALPGDRSGEEDLKFTGFAVRDAYSGLGGAYPQQQSFHTYGGQTAGLPQFMPNQQAAHSTAHSTAHSAGHGTGHGAGHGTHHHLAHGTAHHTGHSAHAGHTGPAGHTGHAGHTAGHTAVPAGHTGHSAGHTGHHPSHHTGHSPAHPEPAAPTSDGFGQTATATDPAPAPSPAPQFTNGQGWVAAGYLGPIPHTVPAPPPAPAPMMGTASGVATAPPPAGGRHRQMLSLPPGRNGDHH